MDTETKATRGTLKAGSTTRKRADKPSAPKQSGGVKTLPEALSAGKAHLTNKAEDDTKAKERQPEAPDQVKATTAKDANEQVAGGVVEPAISSSKVKITVMPVSSRAGRHSTYDDLWPFSDLPLAKLDRSGAIVGASFFIPKSANPTNAIAVARKRARGQDIQYITRKTKEIVEGEEHLGKQEGQRIWKAKAGTAK